MKKGLRGCYLCCMKSFRCRRISFFSPRITLRCSSMSLERRTSAQSSAICCNLRCSCFRNSDMNALNHRGGCSSECPSSSSSCSIRSSETIELLQESGNCCRIEPNEWERIGLWFWPAKCIDWSRRTSKGMCDVWGNGEDWWRWVGRTSASGSGESDFLTFLVALFRFKGLESLVAVRFCDKLIASTEHFINSSSSVGTPPSTTSSSSSCWANTLPTTSFTNGSCLLISSINGKKIQRHSFFPACFRFRTNVCFRLRYFLSHSCQEHTRPRDHSSVQIPRHTSFFFCFCGRSSCCSRRYSDNNNVTDSLVHTQPGIFSAPNTAAGLVAIATPVVH